MDVPFEDVEGGMARLMHGVDNGWVCAALVAASFLILAVVIWMESK